MSQKIQFKRGVKTNLPTLNVGEPALTIDTDEVYIGNGIDNIKLAKDSDINTVYTTTNSGNAYSVTIPNISALTDGHLFVIKFNAASTGTITLNINNLGDISILDYSGSAVTDVRLNLIVNLRYENTSNSFILQGKGGGASTGGTATAAQILAPATATVDSGQITGTITTKTAQTYTPSTVNQTIAAKQYLGDIQTILGDADLISANIKSGVTIFGVAGNTNVVDTSSGDATAVQILAGKKAYVDGALVIGTAVNKAAATITPGTANQTIAANTLCTGIQTIAGDAKLIADNIILGKSIFNIAGNAKKIITTTGTMTCTNNGSGYVYATLPAQSFTVLGWIVRNNVYPSIFAGSFKIDTISHYGQFQQSGYGTDYVGGSFKTTLAIGHYSNAGTVNVTWWAYGY